MKKQLKYFAIMIMVTLASCSEETADIENSDTAGIPEKIFYTLDGEKHPLDVINNDGDITLIENENLTKYDNVFENEDLVTYVDSENHDPLYFSNMNEYTNYVSDESKVTERLAFIGVPMNNNVQTKNTKSTSVPSFTIGRASWFRVSKKIPVSSTYSNRHVGFNKCITGGINFQDEISSIKVEPGLRVSFYVHDNYHGKVLVIDNRYNSSTITLEDLHNFKRKRNSFINYTDNIININDLCPSNGICKSWNDCITSIYAERRGYSGSRNYKNVCNTSSGNGSGSGSGNGLTDRRPQEDPNMK